MDGRDILGCTAENTPSVFRGHCCCCCFLPPRPTYPQLGHCLWVGGKLYTRQSEGTQSASSLIQSRASLVPRIVPDSWSALWGCLSILLCFFFFLVIMIIYSEYFDYFARHPRYQVSSSRPIMALCLLRAAPFLPSSSLLAGVSSLPVAIAVRSSVFWLERSPQAAKFLQERCLVFSFN